MTVKRVLEILLDGEGTLGGGERHLLLLIEGLGSAYEVDVVTWDIPEFVEELRGRGISVLPVLSKRIIDVGLVTRLTHHIADGRYDLVHVHGHRGGLLGRTAAFRARSPKVIWTCHLAENKADGKPLVSWAYYKLMRRLCERTDLNLAVSPFLKDWLVQKGVAADSIDVVRNCVDLSEFKEAPRDRALVESLGLSPDRPIIGTVARLTHQKGIDFLLNALPPVARRHPETQVLIVGDGPLREQVVRQAETLGLADRVRFAGQRTDVPQLMPIFDIVIVPSRSEGGMSFVPLEAMACRKPIICSDIGPFIDVVIDGENGLVVPLDEEKLAAAMIALLDDPDKAGRLADRGSELVNERFSLPRMQRQMREIYERLLAPHVEAGSRERN